MKLSVLPLTPDRWPDLVYDHAGFKEVARRKPARPVVRLKVR